MPDDFCRKPRDLKEVDRWKATELRQFLLYTGLLLLRDILDETRYNHFLQLSLAMRILLKGNNNAQNIRCAGKLLNSFVDQIPALYDSKLLTYNFHCLTHLEADWFQFGTLENISAFRFENFLWHLKKQIKKGNHVVSQIYNRMVEYSIHCLKKEDSNVITFGKYSNGSYNFVKTSKFKISVKRPNNFYVVQDKIFQVKIIVKSTTTDEPLLMGAQVLNLKNLFELPLKSSLFNILLTDSLCLSESVVEHKLIEVSTKTMILSDCENSSYIFVPLIHTT